jgi:hypothetical protein
MKNVIVSLVAVAGIAAVASAQTNGSTLVMQVRALGGDWASSVDVLPGATVEFRALVSYTGSAAAVGLSNAAFQPTVSNWNPGTDTLLPFRNVGTSPATGGVAADSGQYGRILPYAAAGISTVNALRGHTNNVAGVTYLRIAQNNTTNWVGAGPTSGTAAANNFNGAGGIATGQKPAPLVGGTDPAFEQDTTDVEVVRFGLTVGGTEDRSLVVDVPQLSIGLFNGIRRFSWFSSTGDLAGSSVYGTVEVSSATINVVPTPGALALLGMGGLMAGRRRR